MTPDVPVPSEADGQFLQTISGKDIAGYDFAGRNWPSALTTLVSTVLACPVPMCLALGPDRVAVPNAAFRAVLGENAAGATGDAFAEVWGSAWSDLAPLADKALAGESCSVADMPLPPRSGTGPDARWASVACSPVRDDGGAVAGLLCIVTDTTAQVAAERARTAAAMRLREALSAGADIGAWDWDVPADRIRSDSRFALIYNVDPERAATGAGLADFLECIHPEDLPKVRAQIEAAMEHGGPFLSEYRILAPNDEVLWVSAQGHPIFDDAGRCVRFPGLSFDITANKRAEAALRAKATAASD